LCSGVFSGETSIVSYLRGRPSGQVVAAARQLLTQTRWTAERTHYELVTSQYVLDEAADGDSALAQRRLEALTGVPILPVEEEILESADEILRKAILPRSASVDALHIAMVSHHHVDYVLTWFWPRNLVTEPEAHGGKSHVLQDTCIRRVPLSRPL
jgi:predicted nucleic acid-binding protein